MTGGLVSLILMIGFFFPESLRDFFHELPGFILEAIAIICGLVALRYEIDVHRKVKVINDNISTRYFPDWPEHGRDVIKLIKKVKSGDELEIQIDTIGYLGFTRPAEFKKIFKALINAFNRCGKIRIVTLDKDRAKMANVQQFGPGKIDDITKPSTKVKIKAYMDAYPEQLAQTHFGQKYRREADYQPKAEDMDDFIEATMFVEDYYCYLLTTLGVNVGTTSKEWLIDGPFFWLRHQDSVWKEMIFVYPGLGETQKGYAFRTYDGHLMEVYINQFYRIRKDAKQVEKFEHLFPDIFEKFNKVKPATISTAT